MHAVTAPPTTPPIREGCTACFVSDTFAEEEGVGVDVVAMPEEGEVNEVAPEFIEVIDAEATEPLTIELTTPVGSDVVDAGTLSMELTTPTPGDVCTTR
jgi:hypothetical protein